jgi:hypothetical protein
LIGPSTILYFLIALTIVLIASVAFRPSITTGVAGKILAFTALFLLPVLCISAGVSAHMDRSHETRFCISCHSMENYGKSLYIDDAHYLPAAHFQNHRVPPDMACFTCHADYSVYGDLKDKMAGMSRIYLQYISKPPNPITIKGGYQNSQCLHCHLGARSFEEGPTHQALMDTLKSGEMSCLTSGCHDKAHDAAHVDQQKMWRPVQ